MKELLHLRTETSKHFKKNATEIRAILSGAPLHYRVEGGWHDVQRNAIKAAPEWSNSDRLQLIGNKLKLRFGDNPDTDYQELVEFARLIDTEQGNQEYYFTLALKDTAISGSVDNWKQPKAGDWKFEYDNLIDGTDLKVLCNTKGIASWQLHISSEDALDTLLDDNDRINLSMHLGDGLNFNSFTFELKNDSNDAVFKLNQPYVIFKNVEVTRENGDIELVDIQDSSTIEMTTSTETVNGKTFTILHKRLTSLTAIRAHLQAGKTVVIDPTVTLPDEDGGYDSEIRNQNPDLNLGTSTAMYTGRYDASNIYYPILKFTELSDYSNISAATLKLYQKSQLNSTYDHDYDLTIYRVLRNWTETGVTWNNYDSLNTWATAGCGSSGNDYASTSVGTMANVNGNNVIYTEYSASLTASIVDDMADGTFNNYGWILKYTGTDDARHCHMWSSDYTNSSYHPKLEITYSTTSPGTPYESSTASGEMNLYVGNIDADISVAPLSGIQNGSIPINITVSDKQKTNSVVRVELSIQENDGGYTSLTSVESGNNYLTFNSFTNSTQTKSFTLDTVSKLTNGTRFNGNVDFRAKIIYDNGASVAGDSDTINFDVNNMIVLQPLPVEQLIASTDSFYCNGKVASMNRATGQTYKIEITELKINDSSQTGFPKNTADDTSSFEVKDNGSWVSWDESKLDDGVEFRYKHTGGLTDNSINPVNYSFKGYEIV